VSKIPFEYIKLSCVALFLTISYRAAGGLRLFMQDDVAGILYDIQLLQYVSHFRAQGFEKMSELDSISEQDLLTDIGVLLPGHRRRILYQIGRVQAQMFEPSTFLWLLKACAYCVMAAVMVITVTVGVALCIIFRSPQLQAAVVDSVSLAGLLAWAFFRKKQRDREIPELVCRLAYCIEALLHWKVLSADRTLYSEYSLHPRLAFHEQLVPSPRADTIEPHTLSSGGLGNPQAVLESCKHNTASGWRTRLREFRVMGRASRHRAEEVPTKTITRSWRRRKPVDLRQHMT